MLLLCSPSFSCLFHFCSTHFVNDRNQIANDGCKIVTESFCVFSCMNAERIQYITVGADSNFLSLTRKCDLDI